jgi:hypothetical protein
LPTARRSIRAAIRIPVVFRCCPQSLAAHWRTRSLRDSGCSAVGGPFRCTRRGAGEPSQTPRRAGRRGRKWLWDSTPPTALADCPTPTPHSQAKRAYNGGQANLLVRLFRVFAGTFRERLRGVRASARAPAFGHGSPEVRGTNHREAPSSGALSPTHCRGIKAAVTPSIRLLTAFRAVRDRN